MEPEVLPLEIEYEIERGKPIPSKLHAHLTKRLIYLLDKTLMGKYEALPELTLEAGAMGVIVPDIAICEVEPVDFEHDETKRTHPPLAVIEILSPNQILQTLVDKTHTYFSFGVKSCWLVLPTLQSIYVFSAPGQHEVFSQKEELFDPHLNIRIPMAAIFSTQTPFRV